MAKRLEKHQLLLHKSDILLYNTQHGFIEGRSTACASIFLFQNWYTETDDTKDDRCEKDFREAFDLVDHGILLWKLGALNANKSFWSWVKWEGISKIKVRAFSCWCVPQGLDISPLLFSTSILL